MAEDSEKPAKPRRGPGRPFQKGQSGNPSGLPREVSELRVYLRTFTKASIDGIRKIARNGTSERERLKAHIWLAEQTMGKAAQAITGADGAPLIPSALDYSRLTLEELEQLEALRRRAAGET